MSTLSNARNARSAPHGLLAPGVLAAVLLGAVPLVSACGAGKHAPTRMEYSVADGVQAAAGNVVLRNLLLVADTGDTQGGATQLELTGVIANNTGRPDRLTSITATSSGAQVPFGAVANGSSAAPTSSGKNPASLSPSAGDTGRPTASAEPSASADASASASAGASANASASASTGTDASASAAPSASASSSASSSAPAPGAVAAALNVGTPLVLGSQGRRVQVELKKPVLPGSLVSVTFTFDQSGSTTVSVPVYSLGSRSEGSPQATVTYPKPDLPDEFNQSPFDLRSAAPSS